MGGSALGQVSVLRGQQVHSQVGPLAVAVLVQGASPGACRWVGFESATVLFMGNWQKPLSLVLDKSLDLNN